MTSKNAHFKTEDRDLSIKNGQYDSIRINSEVGNIQTQNVKFKHAKVDNENGNILMKNLQSGISLDAKMRMEILNCIIKKIRIILYYKLKMKMEKQLLLIVL
ncbi:DUF4097 family beta strand repeat-containing protein [Staphylococcus saccharolyticus]|uniref:DUF4097 family beta strand repeat-containing protein n=1 Tax=Staphylococcus saccharolyticus TaxID=33028 RepID=UPI000E1B6087|nr:DUF4097 family beta strand repeat protein [Staphylococcus saccharolyticus]MBL7570909.1 DUF4097 family beta strand repeat protein [Staphylococcus saccharolyticus]QQB99307.1 DUF4097 family beta strand repeat protein [Staphylococcus saccharolyticus]QRJ67481.1 DUF4097 family beta strand repeat protein [Staphylococcus saccharolyticus]RTX99834.1 hypothetical protein CD145_00755 [Staphylococcus saccharolyticus]